MKMFSFNDVAIIEKMLDEGKKVEIEFHTPHEKGNKVEIVKFVRWDGLVFTTGDCVYAGIDMLVDIRTV